MPVHLADVSSDNYEQELMLGLMENKGEALSEIESALERIDSGTFGVCEKCQKKIKKARLEAIPYARLCISCQAKSERTSRA
jgi:DnaK suppressor protein